MGLATIEKLGCHGELEISVVGEHLNAVVSGYQVGVPFFEAMNDG